MKIKVADLEPNPFRDLGANYYDEERIEGLQDSILKDDFWGGIPVRPHPTKKGKYQIGACHHRVECLRRNNIKEIEITCIKPYTESQMLRIMINENAQYQNRPKLVNADIEKVKIKLQEWIDQYETWDEAKCDINITQTHVFNNPQGFGKVKKDGVGRRTIIHYLGKTFRYKDWIIQESLAAIKDTNLDREAIDTIPSIDAAKEFRVAVKKHKIPKSAQKTIAKTIAKKGIGKRDIPDLVAEHPLAKTKKKESKPKPLPMLDDYIKETCGIMNTLYGRLQHVKNNLDSIQYKRLKETFMRDGKELTALMERIFTNEKEKKEKRILQSSR